MKKLALGAIAAGALVAATAAPSLAQWMFTQAKRRRRRYRRAGYHRGPGLYHRGYYNVRRDGMVM